MENNWHNFLFISWSLLRSSILYESHPCQLSSLLYYSSEIIEGRWGWVDGDICFVFIYIQIKWVRGDSLRLVLMMMMILRCWCYTINVHCFHSFQFNLFSRLHLFCIRFYRKKVNLFRSSSLTMSSVNRPYKIGRGTEDNKGKCLKY